MQTKRRFLWARTLSFLLLVQAPAVALIPLALARSKWDIRISLPNVPIVGATLIIAGVTAILWSDVAFVRTGLGTPAPYDPTQTLVARGLYRWTRNPMYVGALVTIVGEALLWRAPMLLLYALLVALGLNLYLLLYEEPSLRVRFGVAYEQYCRQVPRWLSLTRSSPRASP